MLYNCLKQRPKLPLYDLLLPKGGLLNSATPASLPWWRQARRRGYYWLLVAVLWGAERISIEGGRRWWRFLARTGSRWRISDRQRALSNLAIAFPQVDTQVRQKIFDDSVAALGNNFHDTLASAQILSKEHLVKIEDLASGLTLEEELRKLGSSGRGVLILTGHLGCWELLGGWLTGAVKRAGLGQLAVVTGRIHNAPVDQLIQQRRRAQGMKILPRSGGAAPLLRHLKDGGVVAVLLDQNTQVENLMVPFFGQKAPTPVGFARIALRYGIPILPVAIARKGEGHEVRTDAPWVPETPMDDDVSAIKELLLWCNGSLEKFICRNPAEWVWFHKRWSNHH